MTGIFHSIDNLKVWFDMFSEDYVHYTIHQIRSVGTKYTRVYVAGSESYEELSKAQVWERIKSFLSTVTGTFEITPKRLHKQTQGRSVSITVNAEQANAGGINGMPMISGASPQMIDLIKQNERLQAMIEKRELVDELMEQLGEREKPMTDKLLELFERVCNSPVGQGIAMKLGVPPSMIQEVAHTINGAPDTATPDEAYADEEDEEYAEGPSEEEIQQATADADFLISRGHNPAELIKILADQERKAPGMIDYLKNQAK